MSATSPLHWSFNYGPHHSPDSNFRAELSEHLESWVNDDSTGHDDRAMKLDYHILPNFWDGYANEGDLTSNGSRMDLTCGSLRIQRSTPDDAHYAYDISYRHETSGEELSARYHTAHNPARSLQDTWSLHTTNRGRDLYRSIHIEGNIEASAITLSVNDRLRFQSAKLPIGETVTCNWSLFDCFAELAPHAPFNLLENLEKLKPGCRITFLEEHTLALSSGPLRLRGYVLHGPGAPPSYWWLREDGHVAIASNIFNTFVRSARIDAPIPNPSAPRQSVSASPAPPPSPDTDDRPNILFINTDQQTWDALAAHGNPQLRTPNMDRLVKTGCSFTRNYCTDPVCAPARSCWATGRYSSETGIPFNGGTLHDGIPDLGQILNTHGYHACHAGKWHVDGRDVRDSFHTLYYGHRDISAGGGEYHDPVSTHAALDFLSSYQEAKPFYLQIGYLNPHDICEYEHSHEYQNIPGPLLQGFLTETDLPPLPPNHDYDSRETITQQAMRRGDDPIIHPRIARAVKKWSPEQWRYLRWQLDRYTEQVDLEIGLLLNALQASPHADNTLIIFSVDHGEAAGCHRMFQKFTLYEESVRTPLIVSSFSDRFGLTPNHRDTEHLTSGVDLLPTVLDYARIDTPSHCHGRSLRPLIERRDTPWRDAAYIESNVWGRALVTTRYKYITEYRPLPEETSIPGPDRSRLGGEELYDLATDPGETRNLAHDPAMQDLLTKFRDQLLAHEATLHRRTLNSPTAQQTMRTWAGRLDEHWSRI